MTFQGGAEDDWHTLTPVGAYTTGSPALAVSYDSARNVHLRGHVVRNAAASGATVFTLAEEYRPSDVVRRLILTSPTSASTGLLTVTAAGVVTLNQLTGTVTDYYLDSVAPWSTR